MLAPLADDFRLAEVAGVAPASPLTQALVIMCLQLEPPTAPRALKFLRLSTI